MARVLLKSGRRTTQKRNNKLPALCGARAARHCSCDLSEGQTGPVREVRLGEGGTEQGKGAEEEQWEGREGQGGRGEEESA